MMKRLIFPWQLAIAAAILFALSARCGKAAVSPQPSPAPSVQSSQASKVSSSPVQPATVLVLDASNFDREVLKSRTQVCILFYTAGDQWSQKELPLFLEAARTRAGKAKFVIIDVGVHRQIATALQVKMVPTVMVRSAAGVTDFCGSFSHEGYLEPDKLLLVIDGGLAFTGP
jgi:hypothetical protein